MRRRPEEALQRALVTHLRARLPRPWMVWATPNGGARSKAEAGILKATGTLAGVPDLFVLGPGRLIALELKAPPKALKSGARSRAQPRLSDEQRAVIAQLAECGVPTLVVRDLDAALGALAALGVPLDGRALPPSVPVQPVSHREATSDTKKRNARQRAPESV